jgi:DNA-binding transcriptional ArsR family regulator
MSSDASNQDAPFLPDGVPVEMPELPHRLHITDPEQYKAIGDETRMRIVRLVQHKPMTVKQMAAQLGLPPGTVGHHVQMLEAAGLLQIVARRLVRGIVAKYYARTARVFDFDFRETDRKDVEISDFVFDCLHEAHQEIPEAMARLGDNFMNYSGFPHVLITKERFAYFSERLRDLMNEFIAEPQAPDGVLVGLLGLIFTAPPLVAEPPEFEGEEA